MSGGISAATLAIAAVSAATSIYSGMEQQDAAKRQAQSAYDAQAKSLQAAYSADQQLEQQNNNAAEQQSQDAVRKAMLAMSTTRVAAGELGASSSSTTALENSVSYTEGSDLSRIEQNRVNQQQQIESQKKAGEVGSENSMTMSYNNATNTINQSWGGMISSGLSLAKTGMETFDKNSLTNRMNKYYAQFDAKPQAGTPQQ